MPDKFLIFKNDNKKSDKAPDYRIVVSKGGQGFEEIGVGWIQVSPKGTKYISCVKSKPKEQTDPAKDLGI